MSDPSSRRRFLIGAAGAATIIPILPLAAQTPPAPAVQPTPPLQSAPQSAPPPALPAGYESLGPSEAAFVEAMVNVMCPADALTPNGVDCGVATFIDRQLAGAFGKGERYYMQGPWSAGTPQLGIQSPLTPEQFFKAGLHAVNDVCTKQYGKTFDQLSATDEDAFLQKVASGGVTDPRVPLGQWFNDLVYPLFTQACFADPMYGGNEGKVFWKLVGYPGLPAFHTQDMTAYRGKPFPAAKTPQSIQDFS
jgi:gluconate 2-dehydrogenase gamma chain